MAKGVADARHGKGLSKGEANENERKNFTEESYRRLNLQPFNNYDWSRHGLNFEIAKGKIIPLGSQKRSMYYRFLDVLKDIDFKAYKDGATNQQNTYAGLIFSGSTEHMQRIAFGGQEVDYKRNPEEWKNWNVTRSHAIEEWAMDTYKFACEMYGEDNILAFDVHLDETAPHIHCKVVPVAIKQQRGNVGGYYKVDADGNPVTYTKGKHIGEVIKISESKYNALSEEKKKEYRKNERGTVRTISYATYFGRTYDERSQKLSDLHTKYYEKVGKKWGLDRGDVIADLPEEERRKRRHRTKEDAYREEKAKIAREQAEKEVQEKKSTIQEQSALLQEMRNEKEALEDAIAEKRQEHEKMNSETWLDTMKGLLNKSDKDKKYLAEISRLEKEALAVDGNGEPVLYKSGNQASWPRYAELLRSQIQKEKEKRQPAIDAAVAAYRADVFRLKALLTQKEALIQKLQNEKNVLVERIKSLKDSFMKSVFGPKFRAAINAIVERFNGDQDRFTRSQKNVIESCLDGEKTLEARKDLGKDAVAVAHVMTEDPEEWKIIPAEVEEIAEKKWEDNQKLVEEKNNQGRGWNRR